MYEMYTFRTVSLEKKATKEGGYSELGWAGFEIPFGAFYGTTGGAFTRAFFIDCNVKIW